MVAKRTSTQAKNNGGDSISHYRNSGILSAIHRHAVVEKIQSVLGIPLTFYGRVIDQNGDPMPNVMVNYTALDNFNDPGSDYHGKSDANGDFSISHIADSILTLREQDRST